MVCDISVLYKLQAYVVGDGMVYYRSSIDTIALNCLVFEKIAFLHFGDEIQDGGSPPSWILGVP